MIMFWMGHRTWSRLYGLEDARCLWVSVSLIACVLVFVYPLRVMYSLLFA